jgi:cytoskeletal protein RodZ
MEEQTNIQEKQETQNVEVSETKEKKKASETIKTIGKIILGVVFILLGLWAVIAWWKALWVVFKGCIGLFLILVGAITIAIAKE